MILARSFADLALDLPVLLTIGTFDGVHRGHRLLLEQALQRAREQRLALTIVTFDPSPAIVLRPGLHRYQLSAPKIKIRLLAELDPDCILLLPFTPQLSRLTADDFMSAIEARLAVRELWLGEDFHFGRDRGGDARMLAERGTRSGFSLHVVERRTDDPTVISSSRIRRALAEGNVDLAMQLLGYPFCLELGEARRIEQVGSAEWSVYDVEESLATPATGAYAILLSQPGGRQTATVCLIDTAAASPISIFGRIDPSEQILVEFIARLDDELEGRFEPVRLRETAVGLVTGWKRPTYPPAGSHSG